MKMYRIIRKVFMLIGMMGTGLYAVESGSPRKKEINSVSSTNQPKLTDTPFACLGFAALFAGLTVREILPSYGYLVPSCLKTGGGLLAYELIPLACGSWFRYNKNISEKHAAWITARLCEAGAITYIYKGNKEACDWGLGQINKYVLQPAIHHGTLLLGDSQVQHALLGAAVVGSTANLVWDATKPAIPGDSVNVKASRLKKAAQYGTLAASLGLLGYLHRDSIQNWCVGVVQGLGSMWSWTTGNASYAATCAQTGASHVASLAQAQYNAIPQSTMNIVKNASWYGAGVASVLAAQEMVHLHERRS